MSYLIQLLVRAYEFIRQLLRGQAGDQSALDERTQALRDGLDGFDDIT